MRNIARERWMDWYEMVKTVSGPFSQKQDPNRPPSRQFRHLSRAGAREVCWQRYIVYIAGQLARRSPVRCDRTIEERGTSLAWVPQVGVNVSSSVRRQQPRHPGEGRDLVLLWAPAFAGVTEVPSSRTSAPCGLRQSLARLKGKIRRDRSGRSLHRRYRNRPRRLFDRLRLSRLRSYRRISWRLRLSRLSHRNMRGAVVTSSRPLGFPYPGAPATRDSEGWSRFG